MASSSNKRTKNQATGPSDADKANVDKVVTTTFDKGAKRRFFFPEKSISVEAGSLAEAYKLANSAKEGKK